MSVEWVPIGDVLERRRDAVSVEADRTYRTFGVRNNFKGAFDAGELRGSDTKYKSLFRASEGDLVYLKLGAWERAFAMIPARLDGHVASPEFVLYEADASAVDRGYLSHLMAWPNLLDQIGSRSKGTNVRRRRLRPEQFEAARIPLPDLPTQRAIAARLDRVAAERPMRSLDVPTAAVVNQLVLDACRGAPMTPFGELFGLERRALELEPDRSYREIGVRSFGRGLFVKDAVTGAEIGSKRVFQVSQDDLVISNIFAWEGAVAVAGEDHHGLIGSHRFMTWVPKDDRVSTRFVARYLTTPEGVARLADASPGSAGRNRTLSIKNLEAVEIPVPERGAQESAARRVVRVQHLQALSSRRANLSNALLPAARNEEFRRLLES